jgi:hypothetical protein
MNKALANAVGTINALVAWVLIIGGGVIGFAMGGGNPLSAGVGLLAGFLLAAMICGLTAVVLEINDHLAGIQNMMTKTSRQGNTRMPS